MNDVKKRENRAFKVLAWCFVVWAAIPAALVLIVLSVFENLSREDTLLVVLLCGIGLISIAAAGVLMAIYKHGEFTLDLTETIRRQSGRRQLRV
jgi:CHASE2 domain-containing sensor protein